MTVIEYYLFSLPSSGVELINETNKSLSQAFQLDDCGRKSTRKRKVNFPAFIKANIALALQKKQNHHEFPSLF